MAIAVPDEMMGKLENPRTVNIAMLGLLAKYLDIPEKIWHEAIAERVKDKFVPLNIKAFQIGQELAG